MSSIWTAFTKFQLWHDSRGNVSLGYFEKLKSTVGRTNFELVRFDQLSDDCFSLKPLADLQLPFFPPFNRLWLERAQPHMTDAYMILRLSANKLLIFSFLRPPGQFAACFGSFVIQLNQDGSLSEEDIVFSFERDGKVVNRFCQDQTDLDSFYHSIVVATPMNLLALLNCRNIKTRTLDLGRKQSNEKRDKNYSEWKTLDIVVPGSSEKRPQANNAPVNLTREHLVRGHFADYRNGAGMFGRENLKGIYWVSPHLKGNPDTGTILNTYNLIPAVRDKSHE